MKTGILSTAAAKRIGFEDLAGKTVQYKENDNQTGASEVYYNGQKIAGIISFGVTGIIQQKVLHVIGVRTLNDDELAQHEKIVEMAQKVVKKVKSHDLMLVKSHVRDDDLYCATASGSYLVVMSDGTLGKEINGKFSTTLFESEVTTLFEALSGWLRMD